MQLAFSEWTMFSNSNKDTQWTSRDKTRIFEERMQRFLKSHTGNIKKETLDKKYETFHDFVSHTAEREFRIYSKRVHQLD